MKRWLHLRREKKLKKSDKGSTVCFVWGPLKLPGCLAVTAEQKGQSLFRFGPRSHTLTHSNTQHAVWTQRTELIAGKQDIWVVFWGAKSFSPSRKILLSMCSGAVSRRGVNGRKTAPEHFGSESILLPQFVKTSITVITDAVQCSCLVVPGASPWSIIHPTELHNWLDFPETL